MPPLFLLPDETERKPVLHQMTTNLTKEEFEGKRAQVRINVKPELPFQNKICMVIHSVLINHKT